MAAKLSLQRLCGLDKQRVAHQTLVELVAASTRPLSGGRPLLPLAEAVRETEELCDQFVVLLPDELLIRTALRGAAAYQLAWCDAHMCTYAERYGIPEILSEDFQRTADATAVCVPSTRSWRANAGSAWRFPSSAIAAAGCKTAQLGHDSPGTAWLCAGPRPCGA